MAYDYIERRYGKRFEIGQRVRFTEYPAECNAGTVVENSQHGQHYVRVKFDLGYDGNCHPASVETLTNE